MAADPAALRLPRWAMCFAGALGYDDEPVLAPASLAAANSSLIRLPSLRLSHATPPAAAAAAPTPMELVLIDAEAALGAGAVGRCVRHAMALRFHAIWFALLTLLLPEEISAATRTAALLAMLPLVFWLRSVASTLRGVTERACEPGHDAPPARMAHVACPVAGGGGRLSMAPAERGSGYADAPGRGAEELADRFETPAMPPLRFWGEPEATSYRLRSRSYLESGIKRPSEGALFSLFALDCFSCQDADDRYNVIGRPDHWLNQRGGGGGAPRPFTFVLNVIIPSEQNYLLVAYFTESEPGLLARQGEPAAALFRTWLGADDAFRNERFKLIPRVAKGPLIIRKGVGATPVLLGKRITVQYHSRPGAVEVRGFVSLPLPAGSRPLPLRAGACEAARSRGRSNGRGRAL